MESTKRKELLAALEELGKALPTMRFGQLVSNAAFFAKGPKQGVVWDVEDEELLEAARKYLAQAAVAKVQG